MQQSRYTLSAVGQQRSSRPSAAHAGFSEHVSWIWTLVQQSSVQPSLVGQQSPPRPAPLQTGWAEHAGLLASKGVAVAAGSVVGDNGEGDGILVGESTGAGELGFLLGTEVGGERGESVGTGGASSGKPVIKSMLSASWEQSIKRLAICGLSVPSA